MGMASAPQWLQLALTGLLIAALPLSYAWVKGRNDRYRQLLWLTLFLTVTASFSLRNNCSRMACCSWSFRDAAA